MDRGGIELQRKIWSIVLLLSIIVFLNINNTTFAGLGFIQCPNVLAAKIDTHHLLVEESSAKIPRLHILDELKVPVASPPSLANKSIISFWHYPSQEIHTIPFVRDAEVENDPQLVHFLLMKLND